MGINELISKFETGDTPTGKDFADLIRLCYNEDNNNEPSKNQNEKFEWRYNEDTESLDLVFLK